MMVGIGAMATDIILRLAEDAQQAGADAVLLPVLNYQPLTDDEVFTLFQTVNRHVSVPICIYDNPRTTHRAFSDTLVERIASLSNIASIKIPGLPDDQSWRQSRDASSAIAAASEYRRQRRRFCRSRVKRRL